MAHFRATIKGMRGEASRLGSRDSGLNVTCNGWRDGVHVAADVVDGEDVFNIYSNGGSDGRGRFYIGYVSEGKFISAEELRRERRDAPAEGRK